MAKEIALLPAFELFIADTINGKRRLSNGRKITVGTVKQYQIVLQYLKEFETTCNFPLRFILGNTSSQRTYKAEKNYWLRFRRKLELYLQNTHQCFDAYIAAVFKTIRTFINYVKGEMGLNMLAFSKAFKAPDYTYRPVILDNLQLSGLACNQFLADHLSPKLKSSLDMFLVGCILGLRFSDLVQVQTGSLRKFDGRNFIEVTTLKTGDIVIIPLPAFAIEIIKRQPVQKNKTIFRPISLSNFNHHLKEIMELAGYTAEAPKFRHKKGKLVEIRTKAGCRYRQCDHFSSHSMRRIAITSLLTMGVPELVVRKISGHAAGSKEFYRYVILAQDYSNQEISRAQEKLFGKPSEPETL